MFIMLKDCSKNAHYGDELRREIFTHLINICINFIQLYDSIFFSLIKLLRIEMIVNVIFYKIKATKKNVSTQSILIMIKE